MLAPQDDRTAIPVELVDTAQLPDGGELLLWRRGDDYSIRFGEDELMGNQVRHSEEALATLVCERLSQRDARILIGGLGMGFTLGAALSSLSPAAEVVVAELVPEIVKWARGPLAHLFQDHLLTDLSEVGHTPIGGDARKTPGSIVVLRQQLDCL